MCRKGIGGRKQKQRKQRKQRKQKGFLMSAYPSYFSVYLHIAFKPDG
jgi:uncharacterized protein Veg